MLMLNRRGSWWWRMAREILSIGSTLFGVLGGNSGTCTSSSRDLTDSLVFRTLLIFAVFVSETWKIPSLGYA